MTKAIPLLGVALASAGLALGMTAIQPQGLQAVDGTTTFIVYSGEQPTQFEHVEATEETHAFSFGYTYQLYYVSLVFNTDTTSFDVSALHFAKFNDSYGATYRMGNLPSPIGWTSYSVSTGTAWYVDERSPVGLVSDALSASNLSVSSTTYYPQDGTTPAYLRTGLGSTNSGPYYLTYDVSDMIAYIDTYLAPYVSIAEQDYSQGYWQGYEVGYADCEEDNRFAWTQEGYQQGLEAQGNATIMANIFGSLVQVPIDVLNGLTPFVIWDVPLFSIILTIVVFTIIVFIIKRFI